MRAAVKREFIDLKDGVTRRAGDEFELTAARFDEIGRKLPGYIERAAAPEPGPEPEKPRTAPKPRARRRATADKAVTPADK